MFISYRHADIAAAVNAYHIESHLRAVADEGQIFLDADAAQPGKDFARDIEGSLRQSKAFVAVIGEKWAILTDERRRTGAEDWVVREIARALGHDLLIIPVLVDGAHMPSPAVLPESIAPFATRLPVELRESRIAQDLWELIAFLKARLPELGRQKESGRSESLS